jgi:hypothetical protein
MVFQLSTTMINNMLDQYEAQMLVLAAGTPLVRLRSGTKPATCAAAEAGGSVVIGTITLSATDFMDAASGTKAFKLPLQIPSGAAGTLGYYRIYAANGTTCLEQGTITVTGGGGDMTVDSVTVTALQQVNITSWIKNMSTHV